MEGELIDIVFNGKLSDLDFGFLPVLIHNAREVHFNYPEEILLDSLGDVTDAFKLYDYVDLVIATDNLNIDDRIVKKVFINVGLNNNKIEALFFFDPMDIGEADLKSNIDYLRPWAESFMRQYKFEHFVVRIDNGNEDQFYFDSNGLGSFYSS